MCPRAFAAIFMEITMHARFAAEWSEIARQLPGRTDNAIKNYWNSAAGKKMREKIRK
jgi:hypothetical protein